MIAAFAISALFGLIWALLTTPAVILGVSLTHFSFSPVVLLWLPAILAGLTMNLLGSFLPNWGLAPVFVLCVIYSVLILLFLISIFNKISSKYRSKFLYLVLVLVLLLLFYWVFRDFKH